MASMPRYHPPEVGVVDHEIVIRLTETELGGPQVEAVGKRLLRLVAEGDGRNIRLDCGAVKIVTAAGLGMLVAVHRRLREWGGRLTVCDLPPLVYEVFEVAQLTKVLDVRLKGEPPPDGHRRLPWRPR